MENESHNSLQRLCSSPRVLKHAAGQIAAPFVGKIVGHFNPPTSAQAAEHVQWLVSAGVAVVLIEAQHRVFHNLQEKIGRIKSSLVSVLVPSVATTSLSYAAHSSAGTDAETAAKVVGTLSVIGYGSLQCMQLMFRDKDSAK